MSADAPAVEAVAGQGTCLNCGAGLRGPFCSACGQRAIPPYPTVREMAGDAWQDVSGYDGRFARTFRMLLRHPGRLTVEVLEGRRARYISPVRLYLVASVVYFLIAAAAPNLSSPPASLPARAGTQKIDLLAPNGASALTPEMRKVALEQLERAPWWAQAVMRPVILDPVGFRARLLSNLPRVLFVLVPVFAGIVALFERRRHFLQHLVFGLHLHAAVFVVLAVSELASFTGLVALDTAARVGAFLFLAGYALGAFRIVYRDRWVWLVPKVGAICVIYAMAGGIAIVAAFVWAAIAAGPA